MLESNNKTSLIFNEISKFDLQLLVRVLPVAVELAIPTF